MTILIAMVGAIGVVLVLSGIPPLRRSIITRRVEPYLSGLRGVPSSSLRRSRRQTVRLAGWWLDVVTARMRPRNAAELERRLDAASGTRSVADFRIEQLIWGLLAAFASVTGLAAAATASGAALQAGALPVLAAIMFTVGWLARDYRLTQEATRRRNDFRLQLPTAIDLMTLSILAGESVPASFVRVAEVLGGGIGAELDSVVADIRAGASVIDALEAFKNRLPDRSTVRFVDALVTGIEKGAPLADVLRNQADDVREARRRALIESGGRREVVMLLPVVFLIMPVVVVFALYPGLVSLELLVP